MPQRIEQHLAGLRSMVAHAERLYHQGILSSDELEHAPTYALEQRFGPLSDAETYIAARQSGDFEKYEAIMNDFRSGTAAQREMAARKVAAHRIAEDALSIDFQNEADQKRVMAETRKKMSEFVDMSGADPDDDFAIFETKTKLDLGDRVEKPVEEPSWSKPLQKIDPSTDYARDFRLRAESTEGHQGVARQPRRPRREEGRRRSHHFREDPSRGCRSAEARRARTTTTPEDSRSITSAALCPKANIASWITSSNPARTMRTPQRRPRRLSNEH